MTLDIDHVGIAVASLEQSIALFESLGCPVSASETLEEHGVTVAQVGSTGSSHPMHLELLEARGRDSPVGKFLERAGPGLHHLAWRVDNLDKAIEQFRALGLEILSEPKRGAGGSRCVFVHPGSTGGVLLELLERETT